MSCHTRPIRPPSLSGLALLAACLPALLAPVRGASSQAPPGDDPAALARAFQSPPDSARPWVYWYFMDGNLNREGMTADLEAMKKAGIGGGIFLEVDLGIPRGPVGFMSEPWRELLGHANREAGRLGLQLALGSGPGWCGTGGPWVKPEQSMQHLVASETKVTGPQHFAAALPQAPPRTPFFGEGTLTPELKKAWREFYRDVAVIAYPTPAGDYRIPEVDEKALYHRAPYSSAPGVKPRLSADATVLPADQSIAIDKVIDLSARLSADGRLTWDVPAGDWTILRLGRTITGQVTRPAPQPGLGLESDKFDQAALDAHFASYVGSLLKTTGEPAAGGGGFVNLHFDSWEMSSQNWSLRFREQFREHRGYDPLPYLPAMFGHPVGSVEIAERFLWDLRRTAQQLVLENHLIHLKDLARRHNMALSTEPYDMNPAGDLLLGGVADVPMCEFWSVNRGFPAEYSCFGAVSAAHTNGRNIIGAEAFTSSNDRWQQYPWSMKQQGDWALCNGINRFVFHRFQAQPKLDEAPGMTFGYCHGVHWERTQTWWSMADGYHGYLSRCQMMLRRGLPVADILYLDVEDAPAVFTHPGSATLDGLPDRRGHNFDGCAPDTLVARAAAKDGRIVFPDGMSYRLLVLPRSPAMTPELLEKIGGLAAAGVPVLGSPPAKSPSLAGFPACDQQCARLAAEIARGKSVVADPGTADIADLAAARWIWRNEGNPAASAPVGHRWFRREFTLPAAVASASLAITADNSFELSVNGTKALAGDNFHRVFTTDLSRLLKPGVNRLVVRAGNGDATANPAGLIAALAISLTDGSRLSITTDGKWSAGPEEAAASEAALDLGPWNMAPWRLASPRPAAEFYPGYDTAAHVLAGLGVAPDFASDADLRYTHRRDGAAEIYFVGNRSDNDVTTTATFRVAGMVPELWDPVSGSRRGLPEFSEAGGCTSVPLEFAPAQSYFIIFRKGGRTKGSNFPAITTAAKLDGPWQVAFDPQRGGPAKPLIFDSLTDWTTHPDEGIKYYSGTAIYRKIFDAPAAALGGPGASLCLGTVNNMARVELNGRDLGVAWCAPWSVAVPPGLLKPAGNELRITVANLWPNRLIRDAALPADQRLAKTTWYAYKPDEPLLPSGLLGPVTLRVLHGKSGS